MSDLKDLGIALKAYRVAAAESVDELAQAIETDPIEIKKIEAGIQIPSKDFIGLVGRHYSLREQEVRRLWKLAGHEKTDFNLDLDSPDIDLDTLSKEIDVLVNPIFYTDQVNVTSNQYGITINFVQSAGQNEKPVTVSRVGMSHQHAASIVKVLQESLRRAQLKKQTEDGSEDPQK